MSTALHRDIRPQPDESTDRPPAAIGPGIGDRFPTSADECKNLSLTCKDCKADFDFTVSEQLFYIRTMDKPNFPIRCSACRIPRRKYFDEKDKVARDATVLVTGLDTDLAQNGAEAPPEAPTGPAFESWDEVLQFADEEDFTF